MKNLAIFNFDKQTICFYRVWVFVIYPPKGIYTPCIGMKLKTLEKMQLSIVLN